MSRRFGTRAVCAAFVIVSATIAVPSISSNYFQTHQGIAAALPTRFAKLDADLQQHARKSVAEIVRLREQLATRLSPVRFVSSGTNTTRITSASVPATAALPSPVADAAMPAPADAAPIADRPPAYAAILPTVAPAASPPLTVRLEIDAAVEKSRTEKSAALESGIALSEPSLPKPVRAPAAVPESRNKAAASTPEKSKATNPSETTKPAAAPAASPTAEAKAIREQKPAPAAEVKAAPEAVSARVADLTLTREEKPVPAVEIREQKPAAATAMKADSEQKPAPSAEQNVTPAQKPAEKQVFASLGWPVVAIDAQPLAPPRTPVEAEAAPQSRPAPAEPEVSAMDEADVDPFEIGNVPISSPVKIRALTRADIPAPEKVASLGSMPSGARNLPPEQQRVAYDAPVVTEEPKSIGRRRWADEAAKYQGLGSPEALLEALRHMGASAKTLGLPGSLWCADFMNLVLRKSGLNATGSRAALSYLKYGTKIDEPRVGAIAIFSRGRNSGHIGIVRGTDGNGNPIIVSGNHNHKVAEAVYPKSRVLAYVVSK